MNFEQNTQIENLLNSISNCINNIQQKFDEYQKANFPERSPQFFCLELNGEAGELANLEKKGWKGREIRESDLAEEAADVFIALMNYANSRNIKLESSIQNKLLIIEKNRMERENEGLSY